MASPRGSKQRGGPEPPGGAGPARDRSGIHPPYYFPRYGNSIRRAPSRARHPLEPTLSELTGPIFPPEMLRAGESDLSRSQGGAVALGQLMIVTGRVLSEDGRPVRDALIELWQANAAGRYDHPADQHEAPIDPNFHGCGRAVTDAKGRYAFRTIKPGAYPVPNTGNWWRPPHLHFSLFGPAFWTRLVTQMYFPGEPLNEVDNILQSVPDPGARARLVAEADNRLGVPEVALGYRFDMVLRGPHETPMVG